MSEYELIEDPAATTTKYGIALCLDGKAVKRVPCIAERRDAEALVALLNELKVEACHFEDVVEDYLTDFSV